MTTILLGLPIVVSFLLVLLRSPGFVPSRPNCLSRNLFPPFSGQSLSAEAGMKRGPDVRCNPVRQPFAINMCNATNSGTICGNVPHFFTAPLGRRIVIEQISGQCESTDPTATGVINLDATVGGAAGIRTVLPQASNAALGVGFIIPATLTRIYPDPGTDVSFSFSPAGGSGGTGIVCNASLIGYSTRP